MVRTTKARLARALSTAFVCVFAGFLANASAHASARYVSINLCADLLLLSLAPEGTIAGLSPFATNRRLSWLADDAEAYRHDVRLAEQVVEIDPDLVFAGRFTRRATRSMLDRLGYEMMLLESARSVDATIEIVRDVAAALGVDERGEAIVREIDRAVAETRLAEDSDRPSAVVFQRRGYVTGGDTLTGELMEMLGLRNLGAELTGGRGGFVSLEEIVAARPDFLIVSDADLPDEDQGSALLAHPVLMALYPPEKRIVLPERLTVCGGPSLPDAIRTFGAELTRVGAR